MIIDKREHLEFKGLDKTLSGFWHRRETCNYFKPDADHTLLRRENDLNYFWPKSSYAY